MNFKKNKVVKDSKRPAGSVVLYTGSILVTIIGIAYLITNIMLFKQMLSQYVAQGYPAGDVINQLLPSQLLPGIYEPIAIYGGIALVLFGAGMLNQKISKLLSISDHYSKENTQFTDKTQNANIIDSENNDASAVIEVSEHHNLEADINI